MVAPLQVGDPGFDPGTMKRTNDTQPLQRDAPPPPLHSLLQQQVLEVDHVSQDVRVGPRGRAQVVLEVAFPLQLEHQLPDGRALAADAAETVPQRVRLALQGLFDEGLALGNRKGSRRGPGHSLRHILTVPGPDAPSSDKTSLQGIGPCTT